MNPRYTEALWCPLCDVPSKECLQPDDDPYKCELCGEYYCEHGEATVGHAGHWITLAERARDIALENYQTNRSALDALKQGESQPYLETAQPPAQGAAGERR